MSSGRAYLPPLASKVCYSEWNSKVAFGDLSIQSKIEQTAWAERSPSLCGGRLLEVSAGDIG